MFTGRRRFSPTLTRWLLGPVLLWGLLALLSRCVQFRMSDKKVKAYFAGSPAPPVFAFTEGRAQSIHYATLGADTLPMVVFSALRVGVTPEVNALGVLFLLLAGLAALAGWWALRRGAAARA